MFLKRVGNTWINFDKVRYFSCPSQLAHSFVYFEGDDEYLVLYGDEAKELKSVLESLKS